MNEKKEVELLTPDEDANMRLRNVEIVRSRFGDASGLALKYVSLVVLVFQNAAQVLLIRYARTRPKKDMFLSTTAVFWTEVMKLSACIVIVAIEERSISKYFQMLALFPIQVTYQLKILTTAIFSVVMLRKPLSRLQWIALVMLFVGVSIVQLQEQKKSAESGPSDKINASSSATQESRVQSPTVGLMCVIIACVLSGFAGIYFEKILKGSEVTVWMRNIQLAVLSIPISYVTMEAKDGATIRVKGVFHGYDSLVWTIISVYALGGLTVAVVIKYADNILKGFATSVAIIVSCIISVYLFGFNPTTQFLFGTVLVILSIYVYSKYPPAKTPQSSPNGPVAVAR